MAHHDPSAFSARLYHAQGAPESIPLDAFAALEVADDATLWIDLDAADASMIDQVLQAWQVPQRVQAFLSGGTTPAVRQEGDFFWVRCVVLRATPGAENLAGDVLVCVAGPNRVLTVHDGHIEFLSDMRTQEGHAEVGGLSAESFVATLLDRQLATYFQAASDYESAIERLEADILQKDVRDSLPELQRLRRRASRLRRMLAPHRSVFGVMSRPDFTPNATRSADRHFVALDTRFERAMDMVEHARELVIGSFELFSSQTALRTNENMRVLTFVTVITGMLATIVGALGMNFDAGFFKTQDLGFWIAVGGMVCVALGSVVVARLRHWL